MAFYRLRSVSRPLFFCFCFRWTFFTIRWFLLKAISIFVHFSLFASGAGPTLNVPSLHSWRPFGYFEFFFVPRVSGLPYVITGLSIFRAPRFGCFFFLFECLLFGIEGREDPRSVALVSDKAIMNVGFGLEDELLSIWLFSAQSRVLGSSSRSKSHCFRCCSPFGWDCGIRSGNLFAGAREFGLSCWYIIYCLEDFNFKLKKKRIYK